MNTTTLKALTLSLLLGACGSEPSDVLDTSVCSQPNALHGTFEDVDGAQFGTLTLDECKLTYVFDTGCEIRAQYAPENDSAGTMQVKINATTPSCQGSYVERSSCTFALSEDGNDLDLDCATLDLGASFRRQGF